jgi:large subunit ribosomal protein L6
MSRIGRLAIRVPAGVTVDVGDGTVEVRGPKGALELRLPGGVSLHRVDGELRVERESDSREHRAAHGLARKLVANMVQGVSAGFARVLEINGVGYRAEAKGTSLHMTLGYSHPIVFQLPPGVTARVERQTIVTLEGPDRELLGRTAAAIRELRPPEPYKGKGIKYAGEVLRRKAGKAAGSASA